MCESATLAKFARSALVEFEAYLAAPGIVPVLLFGAIACKMIFAVANKASSSPLSIYLVKGGVSWVRQPASVKDHLSTCLDFWLPFCELACHMMTKTIKARIPSLTMTATKGLASTLEAVHDPVAVATLLPVVARFSVRVPVMTIATLVGVVSHTLVDSDSTVFTHPREVPAPAARIDGHLCRSQCKQLTIAVQLEA